MRKKPVRFGKYLLLERLSIGGMAEVFCAKTAGLDRLLALKRVLPYLAEEDEFVQMFADEARLSSLLKHRNIASVFDYGQYDGSCFLATEYVAGQDLSSILKRCAKRKGRMPLDLAVHVAVCVCAGLSHAHHRKGRDGIGLNIIHRDVSPPNIMCGWDGEVKLIDFGIAKSSARTQQQTAVGIRKGKIGYMSPEQAQGLFIDQRVDVFALGAVLYEMVTGKQLFDGTNEVELLKKASASKIVPPSRHDPRLPKALERVMLQALAREPGDRFASAAALREALVQVMPEAADDEAAARLADFVREIFEAEYTRDQVRLEELSQIDVERVPATRGGSGASVDELTAVSDSDIISVEDVPGSLFFEGEALTDQFEIRTGESRQGDGRTSATGLVPSRPSGRSVGGEGRAVQSPGSKAMPNTRRGTGAAATGVQQAPRPHTGRAKRMSTDDGPTVRVSMLSIKRQGPTTDPIEPLDFDIDE